MKEKVRKLKTNFLALRYLFKADGLPCMFEDRKRICSLKTCRGYSETPLSCGIKDIEGNRITTHCKRLAAMTALGHGLEVFNKKIVREILKDIGMENREKWIKGIVKEVFQEMANRMQ